MSSLLHWLKSVFHLVAEIIIYLAEKTGKLLPTDKKERFQLLSWLMFQMGLTLDNHPNLKCWVETLEQRPAVERGMAVAA